MAVAFWIYVLLIFLLVVRFRRNIIDRCRSIYFLFNIPGPFSIPLLGSTWMMKWRISGRFIATPSELSYTFRIDSANFGMGSLLYAT